MFFSPAPIISSLCSVSCILYRDAEVPQVFLVSILIRFTPEPLTSTYSFTPFCFRQRGPHRISRTVLVRCLGQCSLRCLVRASGDIRRRHTESFCWLISTGFDRFFSGFARHFYFFVPGVKEILTDHIKTPWAEAETSIDRRRKWEALALKDYAFLIR